MKKNIKELIISLAVISICFLILLPLAIMINNKRNELFKEPEIVEKDIEIVASKLPPLVVINDDAAVDKIEASVISIKNDNNHEKDYKLYLFIDKSSNIDINYLRISLNDTIYKTEYMEIIRNDDGIYLKLLEGKIDPITEIPIDVRIWITIDGRDTVNENTKLITNFVTDIKNVD